MTGKSKETKPYSDLEEFKASTDIKKLKHVQCQKEHNIGILKKIQNEPLVASWEYYHN